MSPERWQKIKKLFHAALDRPVAERSAFLSAGCDGDEDLRREVEELLAHCQGTPEDQPETASEPGGPGDRDPASQPCPDTIGAYRVLRLLGEGGMGVVYLAERTEPIRQTVAIKVLKPGMDSRRIMARFEAERNVLAMMEHPHIARIFDAGLTDDRRPYFVMEYVPGESITAFCDRRKLSVRQRLELFRQVCEAIQHAHHKAVIHRDIKPSNLLVVEQDGRALVKVIDFGVAKALAQVLLQQTLFTEEGILLGTPEYMSPEQAAGVPEGVDTRSDIYSLGVVLYELLAGVLPFEPAELRRTGLEAVLRTIREADPPHPSTRLRSLGERATEAAKRRGTVAPTLVSVLRSELEWIPLKAMRKDPEQRYRSAAELADDIGNYLSSRPLLAGPESVWYRVRKLLRRYKTRVMIAAGFAILLAGSTLLFTHMTRANRQLAEAVSFQDYLTCIRAARTATNQGRWGTLRRELDKAPLSRRNWEWDYLDAQCEDNQALRGPASTTGPWNSATLRQPMVLAGHEDYVLSATFSPDGARVLTGSADYTARVWDAVSGRELAVLRGHAGAVHSVVFSRDNRWILTGSADKTARLWDAATGQGLKAVEGHENDVISVAFSPDGLRILTGSRDRTARLWDAVTGKELRVLRGHGSDVGSVSFSPDDTRILTGSFDGTARLWDITAGTELHVLRGHKDAVLSAAFSPDGARIVTGSEDRTIRLWDAATGQELNKLGGHTGRVYSVVFSPDGSRVLSGSADRTGRLWDAATGEMVLEFSCNNDFLAVAFSPDGRRIVSGSTNTFAYVWDRLPTRVRNTERQAALAAAKEAQPLVNDLYARLRSWSRVAAAIDTRANLSGEVRIQALNRVLLSCAAERHGEQAASIIERLPFLAKQSAQSVAEGVEATLSIDPQKANLETLAPRPLLWYGEFLIVGGQADRAAQVIKLAIEQGGTLHFYPKSLGWALLSCGRQQEARAAFELALESCPDWSNSPPTKADFDHWTAAYFLGLLTEQQYVERWCNGPDSEERQYSACYAWFMIGQMREIEGKRAEAILAYQKSVLLGSSKDASWASRFAAYRLGILAGTIPPPATSRPATPDSASDPATQ